MSSMFRVRPATQKSVDEIKKHYLFFAKPACYKDTDDANIFSFIQHNETIEDAFVRLYADHTNVAEVSSNAGICCFTSDLPLPSRLRKFPRSNKGIVIEYDKEKLEAHFASTIGLGDCFRKVAYEDKPTLFETDGSQRILWEIIGEDKLYKTLNEMIMDAKSMDQLFEKMFTRINAKYADQKEYRIILAGRNIPQLKTDSNGYKVSIPPDAIKCIHLHTLSRDKVKVNIKKLNYPYTNLATFNERRRSL